MAASLDAAPRDRRPLRQATLLALALLALQAAWVLTVPPFRGIDEFDHAYRAAAVAHGQLLPSDRPVTAGRGDYLQVPASLVEAATPVCEAYEYTGPDNCRAARTLPNGYVEVASGAARYNPVFYWTIGAPSAHLEGAARLYAMRALASLACALLVFCAGYALSVGFRTSWPFLGLGVAATPVFVYSTSLGAPNGVEMCAGLALWSAALALRAGWLTPREQRALLGIATLAASVLVTTRLLGPVWLVLVLASVAPLLGRERVLDVVRRHPRACGSSAGVVAAATAAAAWWTLLASPNSMSNGDAVADLGLPDPLGSSIEQVPLWVLQSVAAFPSRFEPAPSYVYAAGLAALTLVAVLVLGRVTRAGRWWLAAVTVVWLGVQLAICLATYQHLGTAWQGRYALPFAVGIPVAAAALVDRRAVVGPPRPIVGAVIGMLVSAHAVSAVSVLRGELRTSPLAGDPAWVAGPPWLLVLLTVAGASLGVLAAGRRSRSTSDALDTASQDPSAGPTAESLSRTAEDLATAVRV